MADLSTAEHAMGEPFWDRVRQALDTLRPVRRTMPLSIAPSAIARSVGLKPRLGVRVEEELAQGWRTAADLRVSMSLLLIEIDCFSQYASANGRAEADQCVLSVMQVIRQALPRRADSCLRLGEAGFVVAMPDMPVLIARSVAAKIARKVRAMDLSHGASHLGVVSVSQGLVVTNPQGDYARSFFESAAHALRKAQRYGMGRTETIDLRPGQLLHAAA